MKKHTLAKLALLGLAIIGLGGQAAYGVNATIGVSKVNKPGRVDFAVKKNGTIQGFFVQVVQGDDTDAVARKMAAAINARFPGIATATFNNVTITGVRSVIVEEDQEIDDVVNGDNFLALNGAPAGILSFDPNLLNGQDTLVTDATVTAGFGHGLSLVSFDASAGESVFQLASSLNTALDGAGYLTRLVDSHDVEVFANGVLTPTELDFSLVPKADVGDKGIAINVQVVPEPSTFLLFGTTFTGMVCLGRMRRRLHRTGLGTD